MRTRLKQLESEASCSGETFLRPAHFSTLSEWNALVKPLPPTVNVKTFHLATHDARPREMWFGTVNARGKDGDLLGTTVILSGFATHDVIGKEIFCAKLVFHGDKRNRDFTLAMYLMDA